VGQVISGEAANRVSLQGEVITCPLRHGGASGILHPTWWRFRDQDLILETLMKKWSAPKAVVIRLGMEINSYVAVR